MLIEPCDNGLTRLVTVHARKLAIARHHHGMLIKDVDLRQVVALAHGIVVRIMSRRNLHKSSAEVLVDVPIGKNRNFAINDRQKHRVPHKLRLIRV